MRNRLLPLGLILLLAALLTPVAQDFTRETIITPLLYTLWVGRFIFESIPQIAIWGLFLIIALPIALRSLVIKRPLTPRISRLETAQPERIQTWLQLIRRADKDDYYTWQLAQRLHKLVLAVLAHDERLTLEQVRQRLADGALDLPPEVETYLQVGMTSFSHFLGTGSRFRLRRQPSPFDLDPERVIQFLEDRFDYYID